MPRTRKHPTTTTVLRIRMDELRHSLVWSPGTSSTAIVEADGYPPVRITLDWSDDTPVLLHDQQRIPITTVPANIGRGAVHYFVCAVTGKRCRVLYYNRYTRLLTSKAGYPSLVYPSQSYGTLNMYHYLTSKAERMDAMRGTHTYNGVPTRRYNRMERLQQRVEDYQERVWAELLGRLTGLLGAIPNKLG